MLENIEKLLDFLWHNIYNLIVAQKVGEELSQRMGRPKTEKPKTIEVKARIDEDTNEKLNLYCKKHNMSRTDVVRKGLDIILWGKNN